MFFWNSAFSMIQQMLAIWSLAPLPFPKPAWTSGSSQCTISNPERWCCESVALNMPANLENSAVSTRLKKVNFIPIPKKGNAKECSTYHTLSFHPCNPHRSVSTHLADTEADSWCCMYFHAKSSDWAWIQILVVQVEHLVPWITILHCFYSFQEKASLILNLYR